MKNQKKTRFYVRVRARNGEEALLVSRSSTKEEVRKEMLNTYKVQAILDISDTYISECELPSYMGSMLGATNTYSKKRNKYYG